MRRRLLFGATVSLGHFLVLPARAEPTADADRYDVSAHSETHLELFRRALLPGPNGAIVSRDTVAPLDQYLLLRVQGLETPWNKDGLDLELAAWGRVWLGEREGERSFDGDVQTANVRLVEGPVALRLGRQFVAGGAARYARFDGALVDVQLGTLFSAQGYAGFTVLPRWNERPGYAYLGAAADSELRNPAALPPTDRGSYWLSGGRIAAHLRPVDAGVSFHEEHEPGGLARRNLGVDSRAELGAATFAGSAVVELDSRHLADARVWLDTVLSRWLDGSVEYLYTEPALFLSRQSVLSVFGSDTYHEAGGTLRVRATDQLTFSGGAWAELYEDEKPGGRGDGTARLALGKSRRTLIMLSYARLQAPDNGYHSLRSSFAQRLTSTLSCTLEAYGYLYDEAIRGYRTSTVYASTLLFKPSGGLSLLWGTSLARSAYASFDAQTQLRLAYDFDLASGRRASW